jgi:hypothetical protein
MRITVTATPTRIDSTSMGSAADESIDLHAEGGAIRVDAQDFTPADGMLIPQGGYYSADLRRFESLWVCSDNGATFDITGVFHNSPREA